MNTLRGTISRLQALTTGSAQTVPDFKPEVVLEHDLDALVSEIERMAGDPLFRGRPLGDADVWFDRTTGVPPVDAQHFQPSDLSGVEILEGRFESTNDRLVGVFEERRGGQRSVEWNPQVIYGLRAELGSTPLSNPAIPFVLHRRRQNLHDLNVQIRDAAYAGRTADLTREQILAALNVSLGAQANTSDRVVQTLLR